MNRLVFQEDQSNLLQRAKASGEDKASSGVARRARLARRVHDVLIVRRQTHAVGRAIARQQEITNSAR